MVLIPTYNESENIGLLIKRIKNFVPNIAIYVIDDNSPDGTANIVREYEKKYHNVRLIFRKEKLGLGAAYINGMFEAIKNDFDYIIMMDSDFSHNPVHLPDMINALGRYDIVIGSRYIKGGRIKNWPLHRRMMSFFANLLIKIILRSKAKDSTSGFRAIKVEVLKAIEYGTIRSQGYSFLYEMLWRIGKMGYRIKEIPITFIDRELGKTKISQIEIIKAVITLINLSIFKRNFKLKKRDGVSVISVKKKRS